MRHVITLSTIPPRFSEIAATLQSLVAQRSRPEAVELYIPRTYRRFPQWGGGLPMVPDGVTIVRVDEDLGPGTKVLPAARARRGQAVDLIFGDDDGWYPPNWASRVLAVRKEHPDAAVCGAVRSILRIGKPWIASDPQPRAQLKPLRKFQKAYHLQRLTLGTRSLLGFPAGKVRSMPTLATSGYADLMLGYGGVAVRPDFFDDAALAIPEVLWAVDDIWISGHLERRGIPIWGDTRLNLISKVLSVSDSYPLYRAVIDGANRRAANLACVTYMRKTYGIWGGADAVQST